MKRFTLFIASARPKSTAPSPSPHLTFSFTLVGKSRGKKWSAKKLRLPSAPTTVKFVSSPSYQNYLFHDSEEFSTRAGQPDDFSISPPFVHHTELRSPRYIALLNNLKGVSRKMEPNSTRPSGFSHATQPRPIEVE